MSRELCWETLCSRCAFFPALAGGAKVVLGGWIAREVGGGNFAQFLDRLQFSTNANEAVAA